jgi:putative ABC transport system permease protein
MTHALHDLRLAVRLLAKRPGFTIVALLTLAIGIGANTAVFAIVNALLLAPLPFGARSPRVVTLHSTHPTQAPDFDWDDSRMSAPDLRDYAAEGRSFEAVGGFLARNFTLAGDADAERVRGSSVTPGLFPLLGVAPRFGRAFEPGDGALPGHESVVLLSHALWQRRYGGDPGIVGRAIRINDRPLTVIGVMPERFRFPERDELWVPYLETSGQRDQRFVFGIGLLREDVSLASAQKETTAIAARLAKQYPDTNRGWSLRLFAFRDQAVNPQVRALSATLLGAVGFVLLIGCANLANLLLARGSARRREMAVRAAIGARQRDLVRQQLMEALLLAVVGGALGSLLAAWALDLLVASWPEELPYWIRFELDGRVLLFAAGVSLLTAIAFALVPALRAARPDLVAELKEGSRATGSGKEIRLQRVLVVGQVALCLALLVGANLLVRSFLNMQAASAGFDEGRLLTLRVYLAGDAYNPPEAKTAFFREAIESLGAIPGVRAAAATSSIPTDEGGSAGRAVVAGRPVAPGEETGVTIVAITPGLFQALGLGLQEGRPFEEHEPAPVALVNRSLARRFWPDGGAVGAQLGLVESGRTSWLTVVGVAPDVHYEEFGDETPQSALNVYLPYERRGYRTMGLIVRTEGDPGAAAAPVRAAMRSLDPGLALYDVRTMSEVRAYTTWEQRFFGQTMGAFAAAAVLLACLGVYGVLAHAVSRRAHEMGVRFALGARSADVVRLVVGEGAVLAGVGIALGLVLSAAVSRILSGVLFGLSAADPWTFAGMAIVLLGVVLVASYLPARRAARVDPMTVLRCE